MAAGLVGSNREVSATSELLRVSFNSGAPPKKSKENKGSPSTAGCTAEVSVGVTAAGSAGSELRLLHAVATSVVTTILRRCSPRCDIP
jgi:hypothetical protein